MSKEIDVKIDELIKERDFVNQSYEKLTRWYNNLAYYMEKSLGYSMIEVHHIANKDFEMQDVERKYNEMGGSIHLEAVYRKNREHSLNEIRNDYDEVMSDDDLSDNARNRKLVYLMDCMEDYFRIPLLEDDAKKEMENEYLGKEILALYQEISLSRVFDSPEDDDID